MTADELKSMIHRYLNNNCTQEDKHYMAACAMGVFKATVWANRNSASDDKPHDDMAKFTKCAHYVEELKEISNQFQYEIDDDTLSIA